MPSVAAAVAAHVELTPASSYLHNSGNLVQAALQNNQSWQQKLSITGIVQQSRNSRNSNLAADLKIQMQSVNPGSHQELPIRQLVKVPIASCNKVPTYQLQSVLGID